MIEKVKLYWDHWSPTLTLALPGDHHDAIDGVPGPEVHHEHRLVHVVVVHDGTVGQVSILLSIHSQAAVSILPLLPGVALVVHPGGALERLVRD